MNSLKIIIKELHSFLILWLTQSLSTLGSSMTNFALIVWSYQQHGSALKTAMLSICSYAPYVIMSIFAGALSDRWNKKLTMLISDSFAALCTIGVLILLQTGRLEIWHLYWLNALNGLMNTIQQPACDVTISLLTTKKHYQKVSGMRSFSNSLIGILTPVFATALLAFTNMQAVIAFDLFTFGVAFVALLFFVQIPNMYDGTAKKESILQSAKSGLQYLKQSRGILDLILFLAAINFTASVYNAAFPAMLLSREGGNEITGDAFGYYGQTEKQGQNWYEVFRSMLEDVYDDADKKEIALPVTRAKLLELLQKERGIFEKVKTPKFVHWDIWAGNVFVENGKITGIIDFERCLWADELMEVGFRTYGREESFLVGYGIHELDKEQECRAKWYDAYLYCIACLEGEYRQYENQDFSNWAHEMLDKWMTNQVDL